MRLPASSSWLDEADLVWLADDVRVRADFLGQGYGAQEAGHYRMFLQAPGSYGHATLRHDGRPEGRHYE